MSQNSIIKFTLEDIMYIVIFIYLFLYNIVRMSLFPYKYDLGILYHFLSLCRVYLILNCIYSNRHLNKKELVKFIIFIFICFVTGIRIDARLFDIFIIVFTKKKNYYKILKIFFYSILISSLLIIGAHFMNILPQYITYRTNGVQRYTWGFSHANVLAVIVLILSCLFIYIKNGKLNFFDHMLIISLAFFCYFIPNSMTSTICMLLIDLLIIIKQLYVWLFKLEVIGSKLISKLIILLVPCIIIGIYGLIFNTDIIPSFDVNGTFFSRLEQSKVALNKYGFSIWGQTVDLISSTAIYFDLVSSSDHFFALDCLYVYMPVRYGIIPAIYFFYQFLNCIIRYIKANNSTAIMVCITIAVYSIAETTLLNPMLSFVFICAWADGYKNENSNSLSNKKFKNSRLKL